MQHVVLAWMGAHDGGVPLMRQRGDGQASETVVFPARWEAWLTQCAASETPRDVIADAQ